LRHDGKQWHVKYAQVLRLQAAAKQAGYSDVVYLDAVTDKYLEEVSSCNIFTVKGKTLRTPGLKVLY
jgi:branched-chain amino acid aminotransferase